MSNKRFSLVGVEGNANVIIGHVSKCMVKACLAHLVGEYKAKAQEGDYNHLLRVSQEYIDKCNHSVEDDE